MGGGRAYLICLWGVLWREGLRFVSQRERFASALVRPLIWLLIFAAGFRSVLSVSIMPPYETAITYETYIVPGLIGMIQLFNGMQSSLTMVYDREMGSMRLLLTSPLPRWYLLFCKLFAGTTVSLFQVYTFLIIAHLLVTDVSLLGALLLFPVLAITGMMLGALGLLLSSTIQQLENFAGIMNFVIFPMFFLSSALYPLLQMKESSVAIWQICSLNPFTYAVEAIRFALHGQLDLLSLGVTVAVLSIFFALAVRGYDPRKGSIRRRVAG